MIAVALIVASGRGHRFGDPRPKQYLPLAGRSVLRRTLETFASHPRIGGVRAVIHEDDRTLYDAAARGLDLLSPVTGGASRQESVRNGLESLADVPPDLVLIHDAVRPLASPALIDRVFDALRDHAAVLPAVPVADSLKRVERQRIADSVPRDALVRAQTPQGFAYPAILAAHREAIGRAATDDTAVASLAGMPVAVVRGEEDNVKITAPSDLALAERILSERMITCTGFGYDVHKLATGDGLVLLGVPVPASFCLIGHSDADVGLHALTDAILGTLGAGDIGIHFPPSDPQWAGADSSLFLIHARDLVREAGGRIDHVDITLVCEEPKIGPHRERMVQRVAELLELPPARVSVKATTTEGLGFAGRREGIGAQAVATVSLPG